MKILTKRSMLLFGLMTCTSACLSSPTSSVTDQMPTTGTIKSITNGDISCYITLVDQQGKEHQEVPAVFEVCNPEKFLNKKVNLTYGTEQVSDCQSAEPCGKTRTETLITKMDIAE